MSDIGGLTLLGTSETFDNISSADANGNHTVNYPTTNNDGPYTILGPVLLPQIYGKDLNMLEIGSSGFIALSVNEQNVLKIDQEQSTMNGETFDTVKVEAQLSNEAIQFRSGTSTNKVVLDSFMVSENDTQNILSTEKTGGLKLDDVVAISQTLSVQDSVIFSSNLSVADDVVLSSNLSVEGVATFSSHAYVEGKVFKIPTGSNAQRPSYGTAFDEAPSGSIFFNTTDEKFQGLHSDGIWRNLGGVEDSDADTKILAELIDDEDTLHFFADDANTPRMTMDSSNLSVALDVQIRDTLSVADEVFFSSNLSVAENVVVGSTLSVAGKATFCNDTYIDGQTFKIPVGIETDRPSWDSYAPTTLDSTNLAGNPLSSGAPMGSVFYNTEADKFQGLHKDGVWRNMGGVVDTDADTKILAEIDGGDEDTLFFYASNASVPRMTMDNTNLSIALDVQITDTLSVGDSVVFGSNLSVSGPVDIQGVLTVDDATVLKSTLSVESHTQLNNTLSVMQTAYFYSTLSVTGNVEMLANLSVNGEADIINNVRLGATLSVVDSVTFSSNLSVGSSSLFTGAVQMENTLSVEGATDLKSEVQLGSTLSVTDTVTFSSNLSVTSDVVFSDTLSVANAVTFANTLSVGGATTLSNILSVTGATTLSSTLSVGGLATFSNDLSVAGDIALNPGSTLTVDNIITTDNEKDLVITLGSDSTGKLRVNGDLEILGTLNQINTTIESVKVVDKTITLAAGDDDIAGSNQVVHEDSLADTHGAGVLVEGRPNGIEVTNQYFDGSYSSADALDIDNIYEKSIRWNLSDAPGQANVTGMRYLGGLNTFEASQSTNSDQIAKESFWEVKGGSLRITSLFKNSAGLVDKVSYGFRISRNRQLQIVKHEWVTSQNTDTLAIETTQTSRVLQTIGVSFSS